MFGMRKVERQQYEQELLLLRQQLETAQNNFIQLEEKHEKLNSLFSEMKLDCFTKGMKITELEHALFRLSVENERLKTISSRSAVLSSGGMRPRPTSQFSLSQRTDSLSFNSFIKNNVTKSNNSSPPHNVISHDLKKKDSPVMEKITKTTDIPNNLNDTLEGNSNNTSLRQVEKQHTTSPSTSVLSTQSTLRSRQSSEDSITEEEQDVDSIQNTLKKTELNSTSSSTMSSFKTTRVVQNVKGLFKKSQKQPSLLKKEKDQELVAPSSLQRPSSDSLKQDERIVPSSSSVTLDIKETTTTLGKKGDYNTKIQSSEEWKRRRKTSVDLFQSSVPRFIHSPRSSLNFNRRRNSLSETINIKSSSRRDPVFYKGLEKAFF